jgi:hypothetical protein
MAGFSVSADLNFSVSAGRKLRLSSSSSDESDDDEQIVMHTPMLEAMSFVVSPLDSVALSKATEPDLFDSSHPSASDHAAAVDRGDDDHDDDAIVAEVRSFVTFAAVDADDASFPSVFARALTAPQPIAAEININVLREIERSLRELTTHANHPRRFKFDTPPPIELKAKQQIQHSSFA